MFYGAAVEVLPVLRTGLGMPFGAAVWLGAHVITVPALGLYEPVTRSTPCAKPSSLALIWYTERW